MFYRGGTGLSAGHMLGERQGYHVVCLRCNYSSECLEVGELRGYVGRVLDPKPSRLASLNLFTLSLYGLMRYIMIYNHKKGA